MLVTSPNEFRSIKVGIASPERILFWSHGEVTKPETINYRTFRPERKGLFCEKIFGPVKDWECACGKYRRVRYRGIVCERCGVEVTHSRVRRERMGHIQMASPVAHIWFLKGIPTYIGLLLDLSYKQLEKIIYYDSYIVTEVNEGFSDVTLHQILSEIEFSDVSEKHGGKFKVEMGAKAIRDLLAKLDLKKMSKDLRKELKTSSGQKYLKVAKKLRAVESFLHSGNRPEWMVMDVIPVMPPDLRPMVQLEGGRFATSDLNDLYRRVVNRNNRLKRLLEIGAPNMIIRNEKRMLQEAVDVLIDNGRRGRAVTGTNGLPLKSLSDIIEGKQGRFRQNLLGKRVDYSGRSVIVVGPTLKLHQCGVPKEMAIELFKPFIIRKLVENGTVQNVKSAKKKIENRDVVVFDVLEEVIKGHPVMLNRAPTLHRLGIQAFEPVLVEGKAIQIHPLVCSAFNADFDGDQMAIHIPLSLEAQAECRLLMLSSNNILSPANGSPIITPTQDMILGIYFLTIENPLAEIGKGKVFASENEAVKAYELRVIETQAEVHVRRGNERVKTTVGRIIFNMTVNDVLTRFQKEPCPYVNENVGKKTLSKLINGWYTQYGSSVVAELCDTLKDLGYKYATKCGLTIAIGDLQVPTEKKSIVEKAEKEVQKLERLVSNGTLTEREFKDRSLDLWRTATADVADAMLANFGPLNNIYIMAHSGARGNIDQVRQLAGMRGLMGDASGKTVEIPIKSNFREGLTTTEYFISSYGARKGIVDTALRTADSGYLTRRLVDVVQDVMISIEDCGTKESVAVRAIKDGYNIVMSLSERLEGRVLAQDVADPITKKQIAKAGAEVTPELAVEIEATGLDSIQVRSVLVCEAIKGLCQKCYGRDLSTKKLINIGEAVGIISAQSIGEPGTQLTMRTFHTGGADLSKASKIEIKVNFEGTLKFPDNMYTKKITDEFGVRVEIVTRDTQILLERGSNNVTTYPIPAGALLIAKNGQKVKAGTSIAEHDPKFEFVISSFNGLIKFIGLDVKDHKDKEGNVTERIAQQDGEIFVFNKEEAKEYKIPEDAEILVEEGVRVKGDEDIATGVVCETGGLVLKINTAARTITVAPGEAYSIFAGARIYYAEGDKVAIDDVLCRETSAEATGAARDIVAGLPRIEELFEARKPKDVALLADMDGKVEITEKDGIRKITIAQGASKSQRVEYKVPYGIRIKVFPGRMVKKGDVLTEGVRNPHDVLRISGLHECNLYLSEEIQKVYRSQGVKINEKHIETIISRMTNKVQVTEMGDSDLLVGDLVTVREYKRICALMKADGKENPKAHAVLLGITKASINTESLISAASFQETTAVLTNAAIKGKIDEMYGLKENVIIGKLIPAGTGLRAFRNVEISSPEGLDLEPEERAPELELISEFDS